MHEGPSQEDIDDSENDEAEDVQGKTAELFTLSVEIIGGRTMIIDTQSESLHSTQSYRVFLHVEVGHPDRPEPDISGHQLTG